MVRNVLSGKRLSERMNKDFKDFQRYFREYQRRFGLTGYRIYFKHEPLGDRFARIMITQSSMVATVYLNSELPHKDKPFKDIKRDAKHEAIHLLVYRLESNGLWRHASEEEISEAVEELVVKLEKLIDE